jgi:hypothetical protein
VNPEIGVETNQLPDPGSNPTPDPSTPFQVAQEVKRRRRRDPEVIPRRWDLLLENRGSSTYIIPKKAQNLYSKQGMYSFFTLSCGSRVAAPTRSGIFLPGLA